MRIILLMTTESSKNGVLNVKLHLRDERTNGEMPGIEFGES